MDGASPVGPVVIFDDDHYYMANVIAEKLRTEGCEVMVVTPAAEIAAWSKNTLELERIYRRLAELGIDMITHHNLVEVGPGAATLGHVYTGQETRRPAASVVMVTARRPEDALYHELTGAPDALADAGIKSVRRIGDCNAPGAIAHAVYAGHRYARELDEMVPEIAFRRERAVVNGLGPRGRRPGKGTGAKRAA